MFEWFRRRARDRFARRVQQAIAAAGGPDDFVYDRENFLLRREKTVANLTNVYHAWRLARGPLKERSFQNFIAAFASSAEAEVHRYDDVRDKLVAVVRETYFLRVLQESGHAWQLPQQSDPANHPAFADFTHWFGRAIVIDFPTHVMVVNQSHLRDWGVTFDEAFAVGLEKLRDSTVPKFRHENGVYVGAWNDDYDSSRILIPSMFDDLPLNGDPVVCLPNRLTLLVAGADDTAGIKAMLARAEELVRTQAKPQNPAPLVVRNGEVRDYDVDPTSPIFHEVQRARRFAALSTYQEQKQNLEKLYEKNGRDHFVATYTLKEHNAGGYESFAVWSKGVNTLLPKVDTVMFFDESKPQPERIVAQVPWAHVEQIVGSLMLDTQMFPPRYFVSQFPTEAQLVELRRG